MSMPSKDPTNRELALQIDDFKRETRDTTTRILDQTTKTNGRVNKLEDWKNMILGALIFTNVILIPTFLIFLTKYLDRHF